MGLKIKKELVFLCLGVALFLFVINRLFFYSPTVVESVSWQLIRPVVGLCGRLVAPLQQLTAAYACKQEILQELAKLREENEALQEQNIELQAIAAYADDIAECIEFGKRYRAVSKQIVPIVAHHITPAAQYLLIDGGKDKGIEIDMVAVYKNILLGRVVQVHDTHSKVVLVTDRTCRVAAQCIKSKVRGIHEGDNKTDVSHLSHVNHLQRVRDQELVISTGQGLVFPKGFGLARVVCSAADGVHQKITLRPLCDVRALSYCTLICKD